MSDKLTDITVLVDRSGSMTRIKEDMQGGINSFIEDQRKESGKCTLTLSQFDDRYDTVFDAVDLSSGSTSDYILTPRGMTALLDALGRSIHNTQMRLETAERKPDYVVFVVVTDGLENASREFNHTQVMKLIEERRKDKWNFVFLGADQDAIGAAAQMGMSGAAAANYVATPAGSRAAMGMTSDKVKQFRTSGQSAALNWTEAERKAMQDTGNVTSSDTEDKQ